MTGIEKVTISEYFNQQAGRVEVWLDRLMPATTETPAVIHEAMRYSLLAGGKRLRPILTIAAGELFGAAEESLLPVACALEMIHTYSLIHDDLPAMDDDDLRRGMPTCHVKYGEALAILAGDALLTQAFITLAEAGELDSRTRIRLIAEISRAAGTTGALIGGQVLDLHYEGRPVTGDQLEEIHRAKTGALIRAAIRAGAITGGATDEELAALTLYGEKIGLAFQIADDLLDETATTAQLGKTAGKDAATSKATYVSLYGLSQARQMAMTVTNEAIGALSCFTDSSPRLAEIARFIVDRRS
jgi:geranylgeranyl diphosphate synthase type II